MASPPSITSTISLSGVILVIITSASTMNIHNYNKGKKEKQSENTISDNSI